MNRKRPRALLRPLSCMLIAALASGATSAHPSVYPTGVTRYDPARAYNGYVLFAAPDGHTYLIDMNGHAVQQWAHPGFPSLALTAPGKQGHLLLQVDKVAKPNTLASVGNGMSNKTIGEVDWNDHIVWQWGKARSPDGGAHQNHDLRRLPNGDTLFLSSQARHEPGFTPKAIVDGVVEEVNRQGKLVWQWDAAKHLDAFGFTPHELSLLKHWKDPGFLHINTVAPLGPNHWYDAGDQRFALDNILINARNANVAIIIDRRTGQAVWRLGPDYPQPDPKHADALPRPVDQMVGEHDVHMIPKGLPGAGNLLVFDNQGNAGFPPAEQGVYSASRVLEIDPVKRQIVWEYKADMSGQVGWAFYSAFIGSARRLPNGNTLIDEGQDGRLFQVTPKGEIVWEYVNPYFSEDHRTNAVYRAQPLPYDWAPAGTPHTEKPVHAILPGQTQGAP